ncbi:MAG: 5'-nucleotidase, partial [Lentisphaeria bacterium]|nr:5'-nucleotidase [Lentisphaeria bacterium]
EKIYQTQGLEAFHEQEARDGNEAIAPGPLTDLFRKLGNLRKLEDEREEKEPGYRRFLKTAIVTARSAPAHKRVVTTLRTWHITVDETHFLGGMDKGRVLRTLRPHIFFDDQQHPHLDAAKDFSPSVHIPFGVAAHK